MGALITTKTRALEAALAAAKDAMRAAEEADRLLTPEERAIVDAKMAEAREIADAIDAARKQEGLATELAGLARRGAGGAVAVPGLGSGPAIGGRGRLLSLGAQLIASPAYLEIAAAERRGGMWRGPIAELELEGDAATTIDGTPGSGGDLLVSEYRPGITELLFRRRSVLSLIPSATTASSAVSYFEESSFTNAAAAVAMGAAKPESAIVFNVVTEPVRKIAHWLPVADEMLEDVPALGGFVDRRLRVGLEITIEDQVLNGNGTAPNLSGILDRTLAAPIEAGASEPLVDAIFRQIIALSYSAYVLPDAIVMNPADWQGVALSKDGNERYFGAGPFSAFTPMLWGLPVTVTPAIAAGTILVGGFQLGAQIFYRNGVGVSISNSHSDFFVKNITAIRAERRLALAVYRPTAFGVVNPYSAVVADAAGSRRGGRPDQGLPGAGKPRPDNSLPGDEGGARPKG